MGKNAQGKTSILEALSLITQLKSFRTNTSAELIQHGQSQASVLVDITLPTSGKVAIGLESGGRPRIKVDDKIISGKSKYPYLGSSVSFVPDDLLLIKAGPEARRSYIDDIVVLVDPQTVKTYQQFQKILKQRNRLLKEFKEGRGESSHLKVWTDQFIDLSVQIYEQRFLILQKLNRILPEIHERLFQVSESLKVKHDHGYESERVDQNDLRSRLSRLEEAEKAVGYTLVGPHRDDFQFFLQNLNARHFSSQGQTRSLVIALKIAQLEITREARNTNPILLLDDIISELDEERTKALISYLSNYSGQLFVTTAEVDKLKDLHQLFPDFKLIDLSKKAISEPFLYQAQASF